MRKKLTKLCLLVALAGACSAHGGEITYAATTSQYSKIAVANVSNNLNVRAKASTSSKVVGQMKRGAAGTILSKSKEWTKIKSGKVTGYVSNDYIVTGTAAEKFAKANIKQKDVTVTTDILNVREKKSTTSKVLGKVKKGAVYPVQSGTKEWIQIKYLGKNGYLSRDYVELSYHFTEAIPLNASDPSTSTSGNQKDPVESGNTNNNINNNTSNNVPSDNTSDNNNTNNNDNNSNQNIPEPIPPTENPDQPVDTNVPTEEVPDDIDATELRREIVEYALQFVGNSYVYGGTSLTEGADCSGYVQAIFAKFGIKINRVSADQAKNGREVAIEDLQPGDLIFYSSSGSGRITHVSLYIGDGQVVHALNQAKGICVTNMYYNTPYCARNVID